MYRAYKEHLQSILSKSSVEADDMSKNAKKGSGKGGKYEDIVQRYHAEWNRRVSEYDSLKDLDIFILDNSIRESTVGGLRGHTIENKWQIYEEVQKMGFKDMIVGSFSHMTRVDDMFITQLGERGANFEHLWAFSEVTYKTKKKVPDTETVPVGLEKMKKFGMRNVVFELDLSDVIYDFDAFPMSKMMALVEKWIHWCYKELHPKCRILVSYRDLPDTLDDHAERMFEMTDFLGSMPEGVRPFGLAFEEPKGTCLPEECVVWVQFIREMMNKHNWNGHLLAHVHEKFGLCDATNLKILAAGASGMWASSCDEGAFMGAASSTVAILNLARMGNKKVLKRYNCSYLRKGAIAVTKLSTGKDPHPRQPIYGGKALDFVFGLDKGDFDMGAFFGEDYRMRITTLASPEMIRLRMVHLFGEDPNFTDEIAIKMKEQMLDDLKHNRKEEYQSPAGLAVLYDRVGGALTEPMGEAINNMKLNSANADRLIAEVRAIWDKWDLRDEVQGDDMLEFDSFYNGFLSPYFGCYRCADTKRAIQALDMDADGSVDWKEFRVYLMWAMKQYPQLATAEELIDMAFKGGILPAMRDELTKEQQ
ncbi:uncharacterized protein LOC141910144 [Tubulanus polymorphus]|uniref:uncharacterized protein LOC141910144 n=1 Tax=Tubulanus polymorphus TaxID=672921 RepID=UPI003DA56BFF